MTRDRSKEITKNMFTFLGKFSEIVNKKQWISHYDRESDSFVMRSKRLSKDARKKYFGDEFAFYFNNKNQIEGIFIEYFSTNFISHNKEIKNKIKNIKMREAVNDETSTIEIKKSEIKKIIPALESAMLDSVSRACLA
jgi:hypothetical protein